MGKVGYGRVWLGVGFGRGWAGSDGALYGMIRYDRLVYGTIRLGLGLGLETDTVVKCSVGYVRL